MSHHAGRLSLSPSGITAFLVCSPRLLEVNARSIPQMRLANALCRFVELARPRESRSHDQGDRG